MMAFSEFEIKKIDKEMSEYIEKIRPPAHIRKELDFEYRLNKQAIELFEVRPDWQDKTKKTYGGVFKATYTKTIGKWKLYWMRADLKWHRYEPYPEAQTLKEVLSVVESDEYACFFG